MRAIVDKDTCTGCQLCTEICPQVFRMEGDVAFAYVTPVPAGLEAACREAADSCPVAAISLAE
jgi:ferredoxin